MPDVKRISHSSFGMKYRKASSSFNVERLGAALGNFKRGIPITCGEVLRAKEKPKMTSLPDKNNACRTAPSLLPFSVSIFSFLNACRNGTANLRQNLDSSLPSLVSGVSIRKSAYCHSLPKASTMASTRL